MLTSARTCKAKRLPVAGLFAGLLIICLAVVPAQGGFLSFPDELVGYEKEETEKFYPGEEGLWEYLNGGADRFIDAGATALAVAYYQKGEDEFSLVILSCADGGRQVLESVYEDYSTDGLGEGSLIGEGSIVFCRGIYLVMLTAYSDGSRRELTGVAERVDELLFR